MFFPPQHSGTIALAYIAPIHWCGSNRDTVSLAAGPKRHSSEPGPGFSIPCMARFDELCDLYRDTSDEG